MIELVHRAVGILQHHVQSLQTGPLLAAGLWDECMHLMTAGIILTAISPLVLQQHHTARSFIMATLAGSVLIDVDHVPSLLGSSLLQDHTVRPYPHSFGTVIVLLGLATLVSARYRPICAGLALGVGIHLFRDMATGGVMFWWPISTGKIECPYPYYALIMLGMAGLSTVHASRFVVTHAQAWSWTTPWRSGLTS